MRFLIDEALTMHALCRNDDNPDPSAGIPVQVAHSLVQFHGAFHADLCPVSHARVVFRRRCPRALRVVEAATLLVDRGKASPRVRE